MASNNLDIIRAMEMVKAGSSPNDMRDHSGLTILCAAIIDGDQDAVRLFMQAGAYPYQDFMSSHSPKQSALEAAIATGSPALDELLRHPKVNDPQDPLWRSLMHVAAISGGADEMMKLISAGVPLDEVNATRQRPIERAAGIYTDAGLFRTRALLALGAKPVEIEELPPDFSPTFMHKKMMEAMSSGRLYNAARTLHAPLVVHVMETLVAQPELADPIDEKKARKWIKSSKDSRAPAVAELFDGFYPALKARDQLRTIVAANQRPSAVS